MILNYSELNLAWDNAGKDPEWVKHKFKIYLTEFTKTKFSIMKS